MMAPNFERNLRQTATFWAKTGTTTSGGSTFGAPQQLACRWEDIQEKIIDKYGQEVISKARVFFASSIDLEGYLLQGISNAADPRTVGGTEIRNVKSVPDLRAIKTMYVAML